MGDGTEKRPEKENPEVDPLAQGGVWRVPPPIGKAGEEVATPAEEPLRAAEPTQSIELGEPVEIGQAPQDRLPVVSHLERPDGDETAPGGDVGEFTQLFAAPDPVIPDAPEPDRIPTQTMMPAAAQPATKPAAAPEPEPGSFTRLFETADTALPTETNIPAAAKPPAKPAAAPEPEPGSFTRLFETAETALPTETNIPVVKSPAEKAESGEFTRLFRSHKPSETPVAGPVPEPPGSPFSAPPAARPAPARSSPEAGDFTRFFQTPMGTGSLSEKDLTKPAPPPKPPDKPKREPSEYTRLFKAPPPANPPQGDSGATRAFAAPAAPLSPLPTGAPSIPEGPSEFTMVIRTSEATGSGGAPPPAQSDSTPEKKEPVVEPPKSGKFAKVMIAVLSVLVVALIGAVLYLALKE